MGTYVDLNDLVRLASSYSNDLIRFSRTNGLTVIGEVDLLKLANMIFEDIATGYSSQHMTTNNSGRYMDMIYERLELLKRNYDPGLIGIEHWYTFADNHLNMPLITIVEGHISKYGAINYIDIFSQAPNIWYIK